MAVSILTRLQGLLGRNTWPPPATREVWEQIEFFAALRTNEAETIRQWASVRWDHPYVLSPLPRLISRTNANLLFGKPAEFTADQEGDQERLDFLVDENGLDAENHRAALIASSEGEVWGRIVADPSLLDAPIIEYVSRSRVIPHFSGRFIVGATFITEWWETHREVIRLLETYEAGAIISTLYRGTASSLGLEMDLDSYERTAGRREFIPTGIEWPLCAFIPNSQDADPTRGYSDYQGLEDRFLALNEAATVGQQNLRLAGRKRALVDAEYLDGSGRLPAGDDVYVRSSKTAAMGESNKPLQMIDYDYDAGQVVAWIDHMVDSTLSLAGYAPESVGRNQGGGAVSGTALRLRMAHTLVESAGKGRSFDRGLSRLLRGAAIIDSRPTTEGGFGRSWTAPDEPVSVERGDGLPRDDEQAARMLVAWTNADAISVEEKVRWLHPEWSDDQIQEEVDAIGGDDAQLGPPGGAAGIPTVRPPITPPILPGPEQ